jgi:tellurite resistance protein TehA-like permease
MAALAFVSVALWGFGAVLYLLLMAIITPRLLLGELSPDQLAPPYWITMGPPRSRSLPPLAFWTFVRACRWPRRP